MSLFNLETLYVVVGLILGNLAWRVARQPDHPQRWGSALFWALLAVLFAFGRWLPSLWAGYLVLALVALAALGRVKRSHDSEVPKATRLASAQRLGNRLFGVALLIPGTAVVGSLLLTRLHVGDWWLLQPKQGTLISLGLGAGIALWAGCRITRARLSEPFGEGGRLLQTIGWPLLLPQLLAALGGIFAQAGVGDTVAALVARTLPTQFPSVAVAAYGLGMMVFTLCLGNAFAAFPVLTLGIGLPLIVRQHGGDPAIMGAIGMLTGFCGTLMTPMAANFNLVPAMLLELKNPHGVIRAQIPIGLTLGAINIVLMYLLVFRF